MSNFGNLIGTLQEQFSPFAVVSILFGLTAILGLLLGVSLMGLFSAARNRRIFRQVAKDRDRLEDSLRSSQANEKRVETVKDILNAKYSGVEELLKHQETHIETLSGKLTAAENIAKESEAARSKLAKREEAWLATMRANEHLPPPTLTKRVASVDEGLSSLAESDMIPDDQVIPVITEADLTANIEEYDLADIEDVIGQDV